MNDWIIQERISFLMKETGTEHIKNKTTREIVKSLTLNTRI